MFAVVDGDGTRARGYPSGAGYAAQRVENPSGTYQVTFGNNDVTTCGYVATVGSSETSGTEPAGFATVVRRDANLCGVFVQTFDAGGALVDRGFHLMVSCPVGAPTVEDCEEEEEED
jgi:hypothetical protein